MSETYRLLYLQHKTNNRDNMKNKIITTNQICQRLTEMQLLNFRKLIPWTHFVKYLLDKRNIY